MIKKLLKICFCAVCITMCAFFFVCCGGNGSSEVLPGGSDKESGSTPKYSYIIDETSITLEDAEVGEQYKIDTPTVIDKGGKVITTYKVDFKVTDPEGKNVTVAASRFTPKSVGEFRIEFTCNKDEVKNAVLTLQVKDTVKPEIDTNMVESLLFMSETNSKPDFRVKDAGGVDESSKYVRLFKGSTEISYNNDCFDIQSTGLYTYKFEVSDKSGNTATAEKDVYVTSESRVEGKVTYLSNDSYTYQVSNGKNIDLTYFGKSGSGIKSSVLRRNARRLSDGNSRYGRKKVCDGTCENYRRGSERSRHKLGVCADHRYRL